MGDRFTQEAHDVGGDAYRLLDRLVDPATGAADYGAAMVQIGQLLGDALASSEKLSRSTVCLAFTVEDADFLATGMIERLLDAGAELSLACFWNRRDSPFDVDWLDVAPIVQEYIEPLPDKIEHLIVLKSIVSGACVIRTNLLRLLERADPSYIHVVAPVMLEGAEGRLAKFLPDGLVKTFRFLTFAVDTQRTQDGIVLPGIGGEIYQRLGLGDSVTKNLVMPKIVERRLGLLR